MGIVEKYNNIKYNKKMKELNGIQVVKMRKKLLKISAW